MEIPKFRAEIARHALDAYDGRMLDQHFQLVSLTSQNISLTVRHNNLAKENSELLSTLADYVQSRREIKKKNTSFSNLVQEKLFANTYFLYEEYLAKTLCTLYRYLPKYLAKDQLSVEYEDLFEQNDINFIRERLISYKVKNIVQSSNIYSLSNKFKTLFGVKIDFSDSEINKIFLFSQMRNVIIHNKSIVNGIYISELRKHGIKTNLVEGDYIFKDSPYDDLSLVWKIIINTITTIESEILKDAARLFKHHESL